MNLSSPGACSLIHDPAFPALKRHVIESTGLAYYLDKDDDFAMRVSARTSALGLNNCGDYLRLLTIPEKGESEQHLLIEQLTIGETYFFRDSAQFDALRDVVIPDLIERSASTRRLRIWCAGCSTGPEPYSIAILLKQEFSHRIAGWDVQILGTDLNQEFLARAQRGRFEEWAMRATPESIKRRWFSREGKTWIVVPECRDSVSFQYHNLAEHPFPSLFHNLVALDLIVCRNVMIYFDLNLIRRIVDKFQDCLVDDGWLVVGHAEANVEIFGGYRTVNASGTTLYRKDIQRPGVGEGNLWKLPVEIPVACPVNRAASMAWTAPALPAVPSRPNPHQQTPPPSVNSLALVRQLADQARWTEAIERCEELLLRDNLTPSIHFYQALVLEQMGRLAESEQSLRRTIYLNRNFALAHFHLGILLQKKGDERLAVQSFKNAQRVLSRMDKHEEFADADGMTVAELRELTQMQMELLRK